MRNQAQPHANKMALGSEVVSKNDPEEDPPAEEEEEDEPDLIDPVTEVREQCEAQESSKNYLSKLEECNARVSSRKETAETCHEEMMDWVHSVDHCVSQQLFSKIK